MASRRPRATPPARPAKPKATRAGHSTRKKTALSDATPSPSEALAGFSAPTRAWFESVFDAPTEAQTRAWPAIVRGENVLLVAPTGSGKTLAAFLAALDRLMLTAPSAADRPRARGTAPHEPSPRTRVVYVSPIKALGVDVEKNLVAPLVGIEHAAAKLGHPVTPVRVAVRSGDTSAADRRAIAKGAADILITTPESLYLMLTSQARDALRGVETVIVDEIHALVPNERGAHLALSLERLEHLVGRPLQRIGLSATSRPLDEVARFLAGPRPVHLADASAPKKLELSIELPYAERLPPARTAEPEKDEDDANDEETLDWSSALERDQAEAAELDLATPLAPSNWDHIFPRLREQVRAHQSTLVFVNSRRLAERAAQAINELDGETLVYAHHGSLAKDQRAFVEGELKRGVLRGIIATSSLELGIDMGAVDCVVQLEPPPSVASGLQRLGRAGHQVGATSTGVLIPKHRGELLACAAVALGMREGEVEAVRFLRNPLDVLAQQLVAMVAMDAWTADALYEAVQRCASFAELPRHLFESTLDMLSGLYPVEELAEIRPRLTYDRTTGQLVAREGAKRVAITNGGTIADRGLYGVYLAGATGAKGRVGELDEEMVFETKPGERFLLGASTWRVEEITHDRVIVTPAPGEPGKMPFWRGENTMRPVELGRRMGALLRKLEATPRPAAHRYLVGALCFEPAAADALLDDVHAQRRDAALPTDARVVIESSRDDLGDTRVCVLSPLGSRVLAPWAMLVQRAAEERLGFPVETLWTNDGFVVRVPEGAPLELEGDTSWLFPAAEDAADLLTSLLAGTSMFAARFREAAARALLLPKKRPGQRTPLWQLRKRAHDLLRGAQRVHDFPILLEAYRKCMTDVFDLDALRELLRGIAEGVVRVETRETDTPSTFATNLLFGYVANNIYEGDVPVLERRAAALSIDPRRLRELMGDVSMRELLDPDVLADVEAHLRAPHGTPASLDGWHDRLLLLGDVTPGELDPASAGIVASLLKARRALEVKLGARRLLIPAEYASRYRDGLGVPLPPGLPEAFLAPPTDPVRDVLVRYAKTHGPFAIADLETRYGLPPSVVEEHARRLVAAGDLHEGAFRPGGSGREFVHADVLRTLRRRSLERLRKQIAPVPPATYVRFLHAWNGVSKKRAGLDALLDAIEKLEGLPLLASQLESDLLPARVLRYSAHELDTLAAAGEVVWRGIAASGERDGRIALYLADHVDRLAPPLDDAAAEAACPLEEQVLEFLRVRGASFFGAIRDALQVFPGDLVRTLWQLTWRGVVANDGFRALRELGAGAQATSRTARRARAPVGAGGFRSRRTVPRAAEGRWALVGRRATDAQLPSPTDRANALVRQWLARYGVVTKELAEAEGFPGGFSAIYPVLRALEDSGQLVRGHFVEGVAALQYTSTAALDLLRAEDRNEAEPVPITLAATDPANPYGTQLPWPESAFTNDTLSEARADKPRRVVGAHAVTIAGHARAYLPRGLDGARTFLPTEEPMRSRHARLLADELLRQAQDARARGAFAELATLDGSPAKEHPLAPLLLAAGMVARGTALTLRREPRRG